MIIIRKDKEINMNLKYFSLIEKIKLTEVFNSVIRIIRKTPLIGKHLGSFYKFKNFKNFIYKLYPIFSVIWQIIKSTVLFLIVLFSLKAIISTIYNITDGSPILFYKNFDPNSFNDSFLVTLFGFYLVLDLFRNNLIDNGYIIVDYYKFFNIDPFNLSIIFIYLRPLLVTIGRTFAFVVIGTWLFNVNIISLILVSIAILLLEINATAFWTHINFFHSCSFINKESFDGICVIVLILLNTFLTLRFRVNLEIFAIVCFIINAIMAIFAIRYIKNFNSYDLLIENSITNYNNAMIGIEDSSNNDVKLKDKDTKEKSTSKSKGFEYLNDMFFLRHKRILRKPVIIKTLILFAVAVVFFIFISIKDVYDKFINNTFTFMTPLFMYLLCKQKNIIKSFYVNCDSSLLYYGFYKEKKNILKMFLLRAKSLLKIMLIPSLSLILIYLFFAITNTEYDISTMLFNVVLIILNGIFFTILPLFQYYVFQPFNQDGNENSFMSSLIDFGMYYFCIFVTPKLAVSMNARIYLIATSVFILIFTIIAIILIYMISHKTFKIKI